MKLEHVCRLTATAWSQIVGYMRVLTAFVLSIKPENARALTAIALSILLHVGLTILGNSQAGKDIDKIGLVAVKVAINSSHNPKQQHSNLPMAQTADAKPLKASRDINAKVPVTDKIATLMSAQDTTVEDQSTKVLTKVTKQTTKKDLAKPDVATQTDKLGTAATTSEQALQKASNKIDLIAVKVAINSGNNARKQASNLPMAQSADTKPLKASINTNAKVPVTDKTINLMSAQRTAVDHQSTKVLTKPAKQTTTTKNLATKPDATAQTKKVGIAPTSSDEQLEQTNNKNDLLATKVAINSSDNSGQQPSNLPMAQTADADSLKESLDTTTKTQTKNKIAKRMSTKNRAIDAQSAQLLTIETDNKVSKKNVAKPADTTTQTDKLGTAPTTSEQALQKASNKIDLVAVKVATSNTHNTTHKPSELPIAKTASTIAVSKSADIDSQAPVTNKTVETVSAQTTAISDRTSEKGLMTLSTPVMSAIPLYHLIQKPSYPGRSRDLGEEGTVMVAIRVAADGSVIEAYIAKTSGYALLDGSALSSIKSQWRFKPARRAGKPIEAWVKVPITFNIKKQ